MTALPSDWATSSDPILTRGAPGEDVAQPAGQHAADAPEQLDERRDDAAERDGRADGLLDVEDRVAGGREEGRPRKRPAVVNTTYGRFESNAPKSG